MKSELKPWHDCPACPSCGARVGCPTRHEEPGRWSGPEDANLYCPACHVGWRGDGEAVAHAEFAREAWDQKLFIECGEQNLLRAAQHCLRILGDKDMHNSGKAQAVYELEVLLRSGVDQIEKRRAR